LLNDQIYQRRVSRSKILKNPDLRPTNTEKPPDLIKREEAMKRWKKYEKKKSKASKKKKSKAGKDKDSSDDDSSSSDSSDSDDESDRYK